MRSRAASPASPRRSGALLHRPILATRDASKEQVATDELREAAAAHYRGMVTTTRF